MIRTALRHHAPTEVAEAVALLDTHAERAAVLGGGTMLVPSLTRGERDVDHVIDLRRLGIDATTVTADGVHIGAMVTYAHLLAASPFPGPAQLLQRVAGGITGGPQIRCQGTICGSAAYANPSSEVPAVLVALDATMHLHGPGGARITPASAFFLDAYTVDLRRGELLIGVSVAARAARLGYYKLKLAEGSWPIATAAAVLPPIDAGSGGVGFGGAVVTLGAISTRPIRLDLAPVLDDAGRPPSDADVDDWVAAQIGEPWDDELAPGDYRRMVAGVVLRRALHRAHEENR
jgi:CO/xanthine dehydrogenase FAD-binding subunit